MASLHDINQDYTDLRTLAMSLLLIATSFISNMAAHLVENYDTYFKLLTLASLSLVVLVNAGKFAKTVVESIKTAKAYIDKLKKK
jgi:N-glycosylase/DNA lyase